MLLSQPKGRIDYFGDKFNKEIATIKKKSQNEEYNDKNEYIG